MNSRKSMCTLLSVATLLGSNTLATEPDPIQITRVLDVPVEEAWLSWTTPQGLQGFFAREAIVDPRIDGVYSVHFYPENPPGTRGAENMRIVALEPPNRLMVTWNAPTFFGPVRDQRSIVEVFLEDTGPRQTRLTLRQFGWGKDGQWPRIRKYFDGGWRTVLDRLEYSYANGPIDWDHVPEKLLYAVGPDDL